jgi:hypothetical protein
VWSSLFPVRLVVGQRKDPNPQKERGELQELGGYG